MKTKGALIYEFNQPWQIEEIEIGDPVKDEVKIQICLLYTSDAADE